MNRCFKNVSFVLFVYIIFYKNICQVQEPPKGRLKAHYAMDNREWKKKYCFTKQITLYPSTYLKLVINTSKSFFVFFKFPLMTDIVTTDSHGHIEPGMEPLWHLGIVASSFIMLNQSTENTLYNMAQVANVTQLVSH